MYYRATCTKGKAEGIQGLNASTFDGARTNLYNAVIDEGFDFSDVEDYEVHSFRMDATKLAEFIHYSIL